MTKMFLLRNVIGVILCGCFAFVMFKLDERAIQKGKYHRSKFYKTKHTVWGLLFYVFCVLTVIFGLGVFENLK